MSEVVEQSAHTPGVPRRKGVKKPHREPLRRELDRKRLAELLLMGEQTSIRQLAQALNLSASTVRRDLVQLKAEWQRERAQDFDHWVSRQLAELSLTMREAWRGWRRSLEPTKRQGTKSKGFVKKPAPGQTRVAPRIEDMLEFEQSSRETSSAGDVRFLELVEKCLGARARLIGLDKPAKVAFTDPDGKFMRIRDSGCLTGWRRNFATRVCRSRRVLSSPPLCPRARLQSHCP